LLQCAVTRRHGASFLLLPWIPHTTFCLVAVSGPSLCLLFHYVSHTFRTFTHSTTLLVFYAFLCCTCCNGGSLVWDARTHTRLRWRRLRVRLRRGFGVAGRANGWAALPAVLTFEENVPTAWRQLTGVVGWLSFCGWTDCLPSLVVFRLQGFQLYLPFS